VSTTLSRLLTSRRFVAAELAAMTAMVLAGLKLGPERVLYSAWFACCVGMTLVSLSIATSMMLRRDVRAARATHHLRLRGVTVLHVGLIGALFFSGVGLATSVQGLYVLVEGETLEAGTVPTTETRAPLAAPLVLPQPLTLVMVSPLWWDDGSIKQVTSDVVIGSGPQIERLSVNGSVVVDGWRYYQDQRFGTAYFFTLTAPDGSEHRQRVNVVQPGVGESSYAEGRVSDGIILRVKSTWQDDSPGAPVVSAALSVDGAETAPTVFTERGVQKIGEWRVALDDVRRWTIIIVGRQPAVWPTFASFLVVGLGAIMMYAVPAGRHRQSRTGKAAHE